MSPIHVPEVPVLDVYHDDTSSPVFSSAAISDAGKTISKQSSKEQKNPNCSCRKKNIEDQPKVDEDTFDKLLKSKEEQLQKEFEKRTENEIKFLQEKFNFILHNEQIRSSYMLREAHRERQEKITALHTQLECKNLAGLMYVLCTERRKNKLEKLRMVEDYTNYISSLQSILTEAQNLILHLSRGYKTAAKVDHEWRTKITKLIKEFQLYVYDYGGGSPETNQYLFDLPALMKIETPVEDNPDEDPCEQEDEEEEKQPSVTVTEENKNWWDRLEGDARPFIMFGDMAEFKPPQRREVLKVVRAAKTAPKKWKEYVFNDTLLTSECSNADVIKDEYTRYYGTDTRWECQGVQTMEVPSKMSVMTRRTTMQSMDPRADMGSLLKLITSHARNQSTAKSTLLAARDSMEIASTTKLREKIHRRSDKNRVVIKVGERRASYFDDLSEEEYDEVTSEEPNCRIHKDDDVDSSISGLGSIHDSLEMINTHVPDPDHTINYEKVCPMERCKRLQVDSFVRALPAYMRASPFTYFEDTFEGYETCSPEQLEILQHRIAESKKKERADLDAPSEDPLAEWMSVEGIGVQTSDTSVSLPPCTCSVPRPSPVSSVGNVFRMDDLIPVKMALDRINRECFYDSKIDFNRFKVIGEESSVNLDTKDKEEFNKNRLQEIQSILKQHPSLLDIFQANTQC